MNMSDSNTSKSIVDKQHICPRCGLNLDDKYEPIAEDIVKEYFKAALAQEPFRKTYQLFGGLLEVVFEEATGKLLQMQEKALRAKNSEDVVGISDAMDFALLPSLVSISYKQADTGLVQEVYSATPEQRIELLTTATLPEALADMPIVKLQAIRNSFANFAKLCADLVVASQDKAFWTGGGHN